MKAFTNRIVVPGPVDGILKHQSSSLDQWLVLSSRVSEKQRMLNSSTRVNPASIPHPESSAGLFDVTTGNRMA